MVLVQGNTAQLDLETMTRRRTNSVEDENDMRMRAITSVMSRMEERRRSFISQQTVDTDSPYSGSPRSTASSPRHTSLSRTSMRGLPGHVSVLSGSVPFTNRNSAIANSYVSPRQQFLIESVEGHGGERMFNMERKTVNLAPLEELKSSSNESFNYDDDEDVQLEKVKYTKPPKIVLYKTEDVYLKSCSLCGITPSQTYVKQVTTTREVAMANTSLSHLTVKPIAVSLVRDHRILTLDVSGNDIGPLGVTYVAEMLTENDTIYELNLSNTNPGRKGLEALAKAMPLNKGVNCLWLEANFIDHTEMDLVVEIIKSSSYLQEVHLGHNNLGYEGCKLLAKELEVNTNLKTLDLQWNHIRKESATHLCNAIKHNKSLRRLDISWNGLGKEGCIVLAHSLPKNSDIRELDLTNNRIDLVALPFLLHGLVRNKSIETLKLAKNPMTTEGVKAVVKAVTGAKDMPLRNLNMEGIPVDKEFTNLVKKMQTERKINVDHGVEMYSAVDLKVKAHDPNDLNRFDPVMILVEYMRIDNLRLIDLFQFFDTKNRGLVSRANLKNGVATLGLPMTEYHLDCIMKDIDRKRDGYIDLEEFMIAQRDMSKTIIQRTTKAKGKGKEDLGLKELRKILKDLVEKRNQRNKEKASTRVKSAALARANSARSGPGSKPGTPGRTRVRTKKASLTITKPVKYSRDTEKKRR